MGGDKIVLLDGAGANGGGAATNGLLSMIPGMFANLIGGNKMDPNLVAALMNGRNNQDGFGGANGWWLWIIVLFWLWGGRGFGNGFGNGGDCCANGLPAQLNNDYGRELLMQAIQGNRSAIDQIASALNCSTTQLQSAICNVQGAIDKVAGQVGMTSQAVINAVQQQGCEIGNQISSCCCNLSSLINQSTCQTQGMITQQGFDNQLRTLEQTNILQNGLNQGLNNNREQATSQFNILSAKLDAQNVMINDKFCQLEMREMQNTIAQLREEKAALTASALSQQQTQNIVGQLRPTAVPAYPSCSPYGYHFSNALADEAVKKMVNVDGSKRIWKQPEIKDIFEKCGAKKPDKATWGDVQYVFAMYYSDGFPKVFKCENELVKATLMYLDDPDAPEGVAFIRWLAVQDYLGEKINWKDLT